MSYGRHAGDLLDRLRASGTPVAVHGRDVELVLDPAPTPARGLSVLRGLTAGPVIVHRAPGHADLSARVGRWTVRLRVDRHP